MIERHVYIRLTDSSARDAVIARTKELLPTLPGVVSVTVGAPADTQSEAAWDLGIAVRFASIQDVERYRMHPKHREYVDEFLGDRVKVIKAWNFDVG